MTLQTSYCFQALLKKQEGVLPSGITARLVAGILKCIEQALAACYCVCSTFASIIAIALVGQLKDELGALALCLTAWLMAGFRGCSIKYTVG